MYAFYTFIICILAQSIQIQYNRKKHRLKHLLYLESTVMPSNAAYQVLPTFYEPFNNISCFLKV